MGPFHYWFDHHSASCFEGTFSGHPLLFFSHCLHPHLLFFKLPCFLGGNPVSNSLTTWNSGNVESAIDF